jgi:hypothetical protein
MKDTSTLAKGLFTAYDSHGRIIYLTRLSGSDVSDSEGVSQISDASRETDNSDRFSPASSLLWLNSTSYESCEFGDEDGISSLGVFECLKRLFGWGDDSDPAP